PATATPVDLSVGQIAGSVLRRFPAPGADQARSPVSERANLRLDSQSNRGVWGARLFTLSRMGETAGQIAWEVGQLNPLAAISQNSAPAFSPQGNRLFWYLN